MNAGRTLTPSVLCSGGGQTCQSHLLGWAFQMCGDLQVGTMTSIFPIAYGFSKFLSGVLGARSSPRIMLAGGLMATAIINVMFGFGKSMTWFCFFWALNGILQVC